MSLEMNIADTNSRLTTHLRRTPVPRSRCEHIARTAVLLLLLLVLSPLLLVGVGAPPSSAAVPPTRTDAVATSSMSQVASSVAGDARTAPTMSNAAAAAGPGAPAAAAPQAQVWGHNVSPEQYRSLTRARCEQGTWSWQNQCLVKSKMRILDTRFAPIGLSRNGVTLERVPYAASTVHLTVNSRGGKLISLLFEAQRAAGPEICHWRVDLQYYDLADPTRAYLRDYGPQMGPKCITWRDAGHRRVVPTNFTPRDGKVCATLFAYNQQRPERLCVPVFSR